MLNQDVLWPHEMAFEEAAIQVSWTRRNLTLTDADKLLFTKTAVSLLGVLEGRKLNGVYPAPGGVLLELFDKDGEISYQVLPRSSFLEVFVELRRARSLPLKVTRNAFEDGGRWVVRNEGKKTYYHVFLRSDRSLVCNCSDYKAQAAAFNGKACCKHAYAVLDVYGFKSLKLFQESQADHIPSVTYES